MTAKNTPQNPFPGLRPFKPEESTLFFGRDEQIGEALERLMRQKLLAVVGVSGCGKSSLVTAGMVPTLEMGLAGDPNQQWRIEIMRPGDGPLRELERCLGFGSGPLAQRSYGLREAVKANLPAEQNLLLVVDQFEEIFTFRDRMREGGGNEADLFISYLLNGTQEANARIYIILTMRSDYLGECAKFHGLPEALNDGQYLVPRMTRAQLQEAIENPLQAIVGADGQAVQFHPGLVQKLLNDCDEEPDNLPLLQHLLRRMFEQWVEHGARGQITPEMAKEVGELAAALNRDAEKAFDALSIEQQQIAEVIFRRITESRRQAGGSKDDRPVRKPQSVDHLASLAQTSESALREVVSCFERRGLLVLRKTDEFDKVDVPHECLCLKWETLKGWIDREAQDAKTLRFLAESVGQTHLTGSALTEAVAWQKAGRLNGPWGQRYLDTAAVSQLDEWISESQKRVDAIAQEKAKAARRLWVGLIATGVLAIVAVAVGLVAASYYFQARDALVTAQAGELAATADSLSKDFPDLSLLLAVESRRLVPVPKADALLRAAAAAYPYRAVLRGHEASLRGAQFSADGKAVLTYGYDGTARVWDTASAMQIRVIQTPARSNGSDMVAEFSPDAKRVVTAGHDNAARLWDASGEAEPVVLQHAALVRVARFSPDGKMLLTTSEGMLHLWDSVSGKELRFLPAHEDVVELAQFSTNGKMVVTAAEGSVRLWDVTTGKRLLDLRAPEGVVVSAHFSPDDRMVAVATDEGTVRLWDVTTGRQRRDFHVGGEGFSSVQFSPVEKILLTAGSDRTARLWNIDTGEELKVFRGHELWVNSAQFSRDGTMVLTASDDKTARLWDVSTGNPLHVFRGHDDSVRSAHFSVDGNTVLTASYDLTARLWDIFAGQQSRALTGHKGSVLDVQFSSDGNMLLTAGSDKTVRLWDAATVKELRVLSGHQDQVHSAQFSADNKVILSVSMDGTARLWEVASGKQLHVLRSDEHSIYRALLSPDGKTILTAGNEENPLLWDAATGKEIHPLGEKVDGARIGQFSADSKAVLTFENLSARLWDAASGKLLQTLEHDSVVTSAQFSKDGMRILTTCEYDRTASLWDAASGERLRVLRHEGVVSIAGLSPDGRTIFTASHDGSARLWDAESGRELRVLRGHEHFIRSVQFSADGRTLLTASEDGTARLWDVASGKELRVLPTSRSEFARAYFSPDNKQVVTFVGNYAQLWPCIECRSIEELEREVVSRIGRELTEDERKRYGLE